MVMLIAQITAAVVGAAALAVASAAPPCLATQAECAASGVPVDEECGAFLQTVPRASGAPGRSEANACGFVGIGAVTKVIQGIVDKLLNKVSKGGIDRKIQIIDFDKALPIGNCSAVAQIALDASVSNISDLTTTLSCANATCVKQGWFGVCLEYDVDFLVTVNASAVSFAADLDGNVSVCGVGPENKQSPEIGFTLEEPSAQVMLQVNSGSLLATPKIMSATVGIERIDDFKCALAIQPLKPTCQKIEAKAANLFLERIIDLVNDAIAKVVDKSTDVVNKSS